MENRVSLRKENRTKQFILFEVEVMEVSIFKIPVVIRNIIDQFLVDLECSTIVTEEIKRLDEVYYDPHIGYADGLLGVLQEKHYIAVNVIYYEQVYRDNSTFAFESQFFPHCSLIMYYLQQEKQGIQYPPKREKPAINGY